MADDRYQQFYEELVDSIETLQAPDTMPEDEKEAEAQIARNGVALLCDIGRSLDRIATATEAQFD